MTRIRRAKYSGDLGTPILDVVWFLKERQNADWLREEYSRRALLLFDHYSIPISAENRWVELAIRLAKDHVPGFSVVDISSYPRKRGRPAKHLKSPLTSHMRAGRPSLFSESDIRLIAKQIPKFQRHLERHGMSASRRDALRLILRSAAKEMGKRESTYIRHLKTIENRICLLSRNQSKMEP